MEVRPGKIGRGFGVWADGEHVGTVESVEPEIRTVHGIARAPYMTIRSAKPWLGLLYIPLDEVEQVEGDRVIVNVLPELLDMEGWHQPPSAYSYHPYYSG